MKIIITIFMLVYHKQVEDEIGVRLESPQSTPYYKQQKITIDKIVNIPKHFMFALENKTFLPKITQIKRNYHIFEDRHIEPLVSNKIKVVF
jgi:hypothetical protein